VSDSGSNFLKLNIEDILTKLQMIASNKDVVKLWTKGKDSSFYRVSDLLVLKAADKCDVLLSFFSEGDDRDATLIGKQAFMSFSFNDIDYFAEGTMIKDESHDKIVLRLAQDIYRTEKRDNERLITFPHHQVYVYFKIIADTDDTNVIELHKKEDKNYLDIKTQRRESLKEKLAQKVDDVENLVGFRALDISKNGVAFLVGHKESIYFTDEKKMSFYILFDQEIFLIKGAKLVYKVDYLGSQESKQRYKLGLTYNPIDSLSKYVAKVLSVSSTLDVTQRDFEDFIDK
jgi:hypothetical protein